jgi:hypothetical protein
MSKPLFVSLGSSILLHVACAGSDSKTAQTADAGTPLPDAAQDNRTTRPDGAPDGRAGDADARIEDPDGGSVSCDAPWADCNGAASDGCETNLSSDSAHCGACGHGCFGAECGQGQCQTATLKTDLTVAGSHLQIDDEGAYFHSRIPGGISDPGSINYDLWRAPFNGSPALLLRANEMRSLAFHVLGDDIYVVSKDNSIARMPKTGGSLAPLFSSRGDAFNIQAFTISPTHIYWLEGGAGAFTLWRAPYDGMEAGTPENVIGGFDLAVYLTHGTDRIYVGDRFNGIIYEVTPEIPSSRRIGNGESWPTTLVTDGNSVYWLNRGSSQSGRSTLGSLVEYTSSRRVLLDEMPDGPTSLALTDAEFFWLVPGGDFFFPHPPSGQVMRMPRTGGTAQAVLSALALPEVLAVNEKAMCWLENGPVAEDSTGVIEGNGSLKCRAR